MTIIFLKHRSSTLLGEVKSDERNMTGSCTYPFSPDTTWPSGHLLRVAAVFSCAFILAVFTPSPVILAQAQDNNIQLLLDHLSRLERDINLLQRQVYTESSEGVSGKALKRAAPRAAGSTAGDTGDVPSNLAVRMETRFAELEDELRKVTGRFEELTFMIDQVRVRLDKLVGDVDFRLSNLEKTTPQITEAPATPGFEDSVVLGSSDVISEHSDEEGTLGVLKIPVDTNGNPIESSAAAITGQDATSLKQDPQQALLPDGTPTEQYEFALGLLRQADYLTAEKSFRAFIEANGEHDLVANAHYWLGETFYVRKDYTNAAIIFADGYEKFSDSPKAPDNLLKLGLSLAIINESQQACKAFDELRQRFTNAPSFIMNRAVKERKAIGCSE
jgi:tol-pal system protein YbgF